MKTYKQIMDFIARVRNNETPMIVSTDYVVMSKKQYDTISNPLDAVVKVNFADIKKEFEDNFYRIVNWDEMPEFIDAYFEPRFLDGELWGWIEAKLKSKFSA